MTGRSVDTVSESGTATHDERDRHDDAALELLRASGYWDVREDGEGS